MTEKLKIGVMIVTFNNAEMLRSVIGAVVSQTRMPDEIVVIDNASPDNTREVVKEFQDVRYIRLAENTGSAGGFYEGLRIASENNDFVLTLDDDCDFKPDTLQNLFNGFMEVELLGKVGAVRGAGKDYLASFPTKMSLFSWRGTLISVKAIKAVGLPIKEYFLYGDDGEYSLRMSKRGYIFFWIPGCIFFNKRDNKIRSDFGGRKAEFYKDPFRLYYGFRNEINMYWKYKEWFDLLKTMSYGIKVILLSVIILKTKSLAHIKAVIDGVWDGVRSKLGKNAKYLPGVHAD
ncbi:MAG: glycosyltransferase [Candidatus Brocadiaceae bacterium]|nr:glycosyltransferase [Candidatus Brocadiaceae bacterium]